MRVNVQPRSEIRFDSFSIVKAKIENQYVAVSADIKAYWHKYISVWETML